MTLLGLNTGPLPWRSASESGGIIIDVSGIKMNSLASDWAWVFKLDNVRSSELKDGQQKNINNDEYTCSQ